MRRCQQLPLRIEISAAGRSERQELCPGVSNQAARWCNGRLRPVLAIVSLATCAVFFDVLFLGSYFCFRDSANYFSGIYRLVRDSWASAEVPPWNPLLNGGQPPRHCRMRVAGAFSSTSILRTCSPGRCGSPSRCDTDSFCFARSRRCASSSFPQRLHWQSWRVIRRLCFMPPSAWDSSGWCIWCRPVMPVDDTQ